MSHFYHSYIRSFQNFAEKMLKEFTSFRQIGWFAMRLTDKARSLALRASMNLKIRMVEMQRELAALGQEYVKVFSKKFGLLNRPGI